MGVISQVPEYASSTLFSVEYSEIIEISPMSTLYIIATPIGNLEDITFRAVRILSEIDVLACEDTRRTRILLDRHGIAAPSKIISYREQTERVGTPGIIKLLEEGKTVGLVSDAGYPGLSDPGYRIVSEAIEQGFKVEVIPGAGAIEVAVISSGLPTDSFVFLGFPPRKPGQLRNFLAEEKDHNHTLVIYESPLRTGKLLEAALESLGDRRAAVCVELTKMFEEIHRGYLSDLATKFKDKTIKGEVTVVIAGNNKKFIRD
jgi:16S rRNA (cytidine1402-2'-O)-methyltransferase